VNAGAGNVTVQPTSAGQAINLGGADAAGTLGLTSAELNAITAGRLTIGNASSGAITISAAIAPAGTTNLTLINNGPISGTGTITQTNLRISSAGPVTLTGNNDVDTLAATVTGAGNGFSFTDIDDLAIGTVDGVTGITTNNGPVTLLANDMNVQQAINAGSSFVLLQPFSAGRPINLGTKTAGQLSLTGAELNRVTAALLSIGNAAAGAITVSSAISPANAATLTLVSASSISGSGTVTVANFRLTSGGAITLTGANDVTNLAANISGAGQPFAFTDVNGFTVGSVDSVAGITTNGGAISLTGGANSLVTVNNAITAGNAPVTLTADDLAINAPV